MIKKIKDTTYFIRAFWIACVRGDTKPMEQYIKTQGN